MVIYAILSFIITLCVLQCGTLSGVYEFPCNMMDPSSSATYNKCCQKVLHPRDLKKLDQYSLHLLVLVAGPANMVEGILRHSELHAHLNLLRQAAYNPAPPVCIGSKKERVSSTSINLRSLMMP